MQELLQTARRLPERQTQRIPHLVIANNNLTSVREFDIKQKFVLK